MLQRLRQLLAGTAASSETGYSAQYRTRNAAILHVDMVASTDRVRSDPARAHRQIEQLYTRLCFIAGVHNAIPRELRGDAAVVEFHSVVDAVRAAQALHCVHAAMSKSRLGLENPRIRTGISFGEIIGESMLTGEAVIRAQRLEQLSEPGQVLLDQPAAAQLSCANEILLVPLGTRVLKGFDDPEAIYRVKVATGSQSESSYPACRVQVRGRAA